MSEYQYYEFLALDRALTSRQREELRQLSTRAEITATRFTNEYHWGSFRGDPEKMMASYFDAFLYLANWGTRHLMFRVPRVALDTEYAEQYCYTEAASLIETDDHLIISLYADREPDDYWDQASGELGGMVAARSELLAGDHRLLYLAWLIGIQWDHADEEDKLLTMVAEGEGPQVQALLLRRSRRSPETRNCAGPSARKAAQLWAAASARKGVREEAEAQARRAEEERRAAAKTAAYGKRLDHLATSTETAWKETADLIETKRPRDYDLAVSLLRDLSALARREGEHDSFTGRFLELRAKHERKPSLQERFDKAGLPRRP